MSFAKKPQSLLVNILILLILVCINPENRVNASSSAPWVSGAMLNDIRFIIYDFSFAYGAIGDIELEGSELSEAIGRGINKGFESSPWIETLFNKNIDQDLRRSRNTLLLQLTFSIHDVNNPDGITKIITVTNQLYRNNPDKQDNHRYVSLPILYSGDKQDLISEIEFVAERFTTYLSDIAKCEHLKTNEACKTTVARLETKK